MGFFRRKGKEEETCAEEAPVKEEKKAEKSVKAKTTKTVAKTDETSDDQESKNTVKKAAYVVSTHADGGWQVKKAGSTKAIKRFGTKAEADAYAKQLASKNGASVIRKKKDGKIQKKK